MQVFVLTREGRLGQEGKAQEEEELLWLAVVLKGEGLESRDVVVVLVVAVVEGGRDGADVGDRNMEELVEAKVKLEPKLFSILAVGWLGEAFREKGSNGDMVYVSIVYRSIEVKIKERCSQERKKRGINTRNATPENKKQQRMHHRNPIPGN